MSDFSVWLTITVLLFGLMTLCYYMFKKEQQKLKASWVKMPDKRPSKKGHRNKVKCNTETEYLQKKDWEDPPQAHIKPS